MNQILGEIRLFPYDDIPKGWLKCNGQTLKINKYPKLYMLVGTKFGKRDDFEFSLPDLSEDSPEKITYFISVEGQLPKI